MIIVADQNIPRVEEIFSAIGDVRTFDGRLINNQVLLDADILLTRSVTQVNQQLLDKTAVKFVATATIGIDHLDVGYLNDSGIGWSSAPGCNANSVVDYIFSVFSQVDEVFENLIGGNATVGIIGMGNVGSRLYTRLRGLGVECRVYDPLIKQDKYPDLDSLERVLGADIICCHAPLTRNSPYPTYHMLGKQELLKLKDGALLINAGRGEVIDGRALKAVLDERPELRVVLDVWENEPAIDIDLMKRLTLASPHIAGYSYDGKITGTTMIYKSCCDFLDLDCTVDNSISPSDENLSIEINSELTLADSAREAIFTVYRVAQDDRIIRDQLLSLDTPARALAFDQMRKNYRVRREFSCFSIGNFHTLSKQLQQNLLALGFLKPAL